MKFDGLKTQLTIYNIITIVLITLFATTLFMGYKNVCRLIYPDYFEQYQAILGDKTKDMRQQKLGIGHVIKFQYKENRRSLDELYSLTDIKFTPENKILAAWKGKNKTENWNEDTALTGKMQRFRIKFNIPVPNDERIQGKTIKGVLSFNLSYPILVDYTARKGSTHTELWEKPLSVHIFSKPELNRISILEASMLKVWIACLAAFFFPISILFFYQAKQYRKLHPPKIE